jgi:hypothetical protein
MLISDDGPPFRNQKAMPITVPNRFRLNCDPSNWPSALGIDKPSNEGLWAAVLLSRTILTEGSGQARQSHDKQGNPNSHRDFLPSS